MSRIPAPSLHKEIFDIYAKYDKSGFHGRLTEIREDKALYDELAGYFASGRQGTCTVLGIDIYKYSTFIDEKQRLIPAIFAEFYRNTVKLLLEHEPFLFQGHSGESLKAQFVSTGDGGFQILQTPLHALFFAVYFETVLDAYNKYVNYPQLRVRVGEISLRYAMTYETLINFEGNYFGPAIILNARILSRDHLNRFLIDSNSNEWFSQKLKGVENLISTNCARIAEQVDFKDYEKAALENANYGSLLLSPSNKSIRQLNCMKIGKVESKEAELDVYSIYLQAMLTATADEGSGRIEIVISLGNLNSSGI